MLKFDDLSMKMQMAGCIQVAFLWEKWSLGFMYGHSSAVQNFSFWSKKKRRFSYTSNKRNWYVANILQKINFKPKNHKVKITFKTAAGCFSISLSDYCCWLWRSRNGMTSNVQSIDSNSRSWWDLTVLKLQVPARLFNKRIFKWHNYVNKKGGKDLMIWSFCVKLKWKDWTSSGLTVGSHWQWPGVSNNGKSFVPALGWLSTAGQPCCVPQKTPQLRLLLCLLWSWTHAGRLIFHICQIEIGRKSEAGQTSGLPTEFLFVLPRN